MHRGRVPGGQRRSRCSRATSPRAPADCWRSCSSSPTRSSCCSSRSCSAADAPTPPTGRVLVLPGDRGRDPVPDASARSRPGACVATGYAGWALVLDHDLPGRDRRPAARDRAPRRAPERLPRREPRGRDRRAPPRPATKPSNAGACCAPPRSAGAGARASTSTRSSTCSATPSPRWDSPNRRCSSWSAKRRGLVARPVRQSRSPRRRAGRAAARGGRPRRPDGRLDHVAARRRPPRRRAARQRDAGPLRRFGYSRLFAVPVTARRAPAHRAGRALAGARRCRPRRRPRASSCSRRRPAPRCATRRCTSSCRR